MKRPAQPEELSPASVFLALPVYSNYITGEVLGVIGGVTGSSQARQGIRRLKTED